MKSSSCSEMKRERACVCVCVCVCISLGHEIRGSQPNCCRLVRTVSFVVMHQLSLQGSGACCWSHHSTKTLLQHGDMESGR